MAEIVRDLLRDPQVRLGDERADPVVHQPRLHGILLVDQDPHGRLGGVEAAERLELRDQVGRQDQRRERVARLDHLPRLRLLDTGMQSSREQSSLLAPVMSNCVPPRTSGVPLRHLVEEGNPGLLRPAREREPDQHRDRHRVEHQEHRHQGRAAQDLEVLQEEPAHFGSGPAHADQWPRSRRKATNACSKSRAAGLGHGRVQLAGGAVEERLAVGQDQQSLAVALRLGDVVGGEDHGRAAAREIEDELPEALALARVEARARLVEQQDRGPGQQPEGDVDPLLVSARQGPDLIVAAIAKRASARASPRPRRRCRRCPRAGRTGAGSRSTVRRR